MPTLEWIGKEKVINHHQEVPFRVLDRQYSFDENGQHAGEKVNCAEGAREAALGRNGSENMIIHGDNLDALKALLPRYEGRVKCIYIDPPYNTGNEGWVYNDNVNDPKIKKWLGEVVGKEGEDLTRHDKWLCMMYPRLKLLWKLLEPSNGVIFISIDENEFANLKLLCNEVFGANHFIISIAWQKRYSRENRGAIGDSHEYILVYATNPEVFKNTRNYLPLTDKQLKAYSNPDNDPRGPWQSVSLLAQGYRPNQMYEIVAPNGRIHTPPDGNCWKIIRSEYEKALTDNRITFGNSGDGVPRRKQFLREAKGLVPWSWWPFEEVGHTDEAKKEIKAILGDITAFDTPKPVRLLERILQIASDPDSIILDSFAGSGTTAHAVLNMNKADGGNRKFILAEMMDYADSITAERVRRVIRGYGEGKNAVEGTGGSFSYYELGEPLLIGENLNEAVEPEKIREYIWFMETKTPYTPAAGENLYYLGKHNDTGYYFYYEPQRITVLDYDFLAAVTEKAGGTVIYADRCSIDDGKLSQMGIVFKKIPRDISRL